jgi:hypothetical protein
MDRPFRRADGVELVARPRHPRAAVKGGAGHYRPQSASALRIAERVECATQGIHQCQPCRCLGFVATHLIVEHVLGDVAKYSVSRQTRRIRGIGFLRHNRLRRR